MKQKNKKFVIYITGQNDSSMPFNLRQNDFDFNFEFTRTAEGAFSVSNFDPKKHKISASVNKLGGDVFYQNDGDNTMYTTIGDIPNDFTFEFGGWIEIVEYPVILL